MILKYDIEKLKGTKINRLTILQEGERMLDGNKTRRGVEVRCDCGVTKNVKLMQLMNNRIKSCGECYEDLIGVKNGYLTVIEDLGLTENDNRLLKVKCSNCGSEKKYINTVFKNKTHCGCIREPRAIKEINSIKGVYKIVVELDKKSRGGYRMVEAECTLCGETHELVYKNIDKNNILGCSKCANKNYVYENKLSELDIKIRNVFSNMKVRCYNSNSKDYKNYGGRGITICDDWLEKPSEFYEWSITNGYALGLEIDREDNDLGYSPQNCRWVTKKVNSRNTRQVKLTEELVREIRYGKYKDTPQYIIAKLIGCTNSTINSVVWRKVGRISNIQNIQ